MFSAKPVLVSLNCYRSIISEANSGKFIVSDNFGLLAESIEEYSYIDKMRIKIFYCNFRAIKTKLLNNNMLVNKLLYSFKAQRIIFRTIFNF